MHLGNEVVELKVTDDGIGFEPAEISDKGGIGLTIIQEKAKLLGGSFLF